MYKQYMQSDEELEFADYIEKYASRRFLRMSDKEEERQEETPRHFYDSVYTRQIKDTK